MSPRAPATAGESDGMSELLRVDKQRVTATLTLTEGGRLAGALFLADLAATHAGRERLLDVLNGSPGFLPFETPADGAPRTVLINRAHITVVEADCAERDLADDPAYQVAVKKSVDLRLEGGDQLSGVLRVVRPAGRDRLSDAVRDDVGFRYLETASGVLVINLAHVLRITPLAE